MKKRLYIVTIVLLLIVFGVSAFHVVSYIIGSRQQASKYDEMAAALDAQDAAVSTAPSTPAQDPTAGTDSEPTVPVMEYVEDPIDEETGVLVRYLDFYKQNPDLVGWIKIEGTKLNYPVMQTPHDKDFYLKHNFEREYSDWGAIYAREECDIFKPSDNITIYGHTMKDGSMFACLHEYTDKAVWETNNVIFFDTIHERHVYQIFAVFTTTASLGEGFSYHQMEDAVDEADFNEFIATCKELSLYETGITPKYGEKTICLSTCEYSQDNGRLVVAAVRIY
jgi:sortase B